MSESLSPDWPPAALPLTIKWDAQLQEWLVLDRGEEIKHFGSLLEAEQWVIEESTRREGLA